MLDFIAEHRKIAINKEIEGVIRISRAAKS